MNLFLYRVIGLILIIGALLGVVFSGVGLVYIWRIEEPLNESISRNLDLIDSTLTTSAEGLEIVSISLEQTISTVTLLKSTLESLSQSLGNSIPSVEQSSALISNDLVEVINNTINSLEASQASAQLVDDTLRFITSLPLIGRRYAPTMTLGESIEAIQNSLVDLPESLVELGEGMESAAKSMRGIQTEVFGLSTDIINAEQSLARSQVVIVEYQKQVSELQSRMVDFRTNVPIWINTLQWVLTVFLIWLLIAQVGLLTQAIYHLTRAA